MRCFRGNDAAFFFGETPTTLTRRLTAESTAIARAAPLWRVRLTSPFYPDSKR
jgi:hypothetical protein